jgi:hypothetical protein
MTPVLMSVCIGFLTVNAEAADLIVVQPDGSPIRWQEWLEANGSAAVLVWSSWLPAGPDALESVTALERAAGEAGLDFVVVGVQESFEDTAARLRPSGVDWLHDRHGSILKEYRLIDLPAVLVVDPAGKALARLKPTAEALRAWRQ